MASRNLAAHVCRDLGCAQPYATMWKPMTPSRPALLDKSHNQHRCPFCRFLIFHVRSDGMAHYGQCQCRLWQFDLWDDRGGRWYTRLLQLS